MRSDNLRLFCVQPRMSLQIRSWRLFIFFISFGEIYHRTDRTLASSPYRGSFCNSCNVSKQASIIQNHRNNSFLGGIGTPCPCCPSHAQACAPRSGSQGGGFDDCESDSNNDGDDNDDDIGIIMMEVLMVRVRIRAILLTHRCVLHHQGA